MSHHYDAIVIGARCAGSPTAMLLARKGYKVLVVDRATFPSDTVSTHLIQPQGIAALRRWGLLDRLVATGCPAIDTYVFDFGPLVITGSPGTTDSPVSYSPRRTILDKLLVDAAAEAGAEIRERFSVDEVMVSDGQVTGIRGRDSNGASVTETARIVIGADGHNSLVARAVSPDRYHEKPPLLAGYYAYWSGLDMRGRFETYIRPRRGFAAMPTHDGMTLIVGGWPYVEFESGKHELEKNFLSMFELAPAFAERVRGAKRESRLLGMPIPNYFRKPFGAGWALVGDAGYLKDAITAQGIADAFRDAESLVGALDAWMSKGESFQTVMSDHQAERDSHALPMYEFTTQLATLEPPPPPLVQLLGATAGNQDAMDAFCRVNAGLTSPAEFFSEENVGRILATAQANASGAGVGSSTSGVAPTSSNPLIHGTVSRD